MEFEDLSRQRIDFSTGPNGETMATLTITMANGGGTYRYTASTDDEEVDALASALATAETRAERIEGVLSEDEIAGLFSDVWSGVKSVANVAKKVVTSKVFKAAAAGLAIAAPALGPLAPALLAVSGTMAAASALGTAAVAAEGRAKKTARKLARVARNVTRRLSKTKKGRRKLLRIANRKRKAALRFAKRFGRKRKPARKRPARKRSTARRRPTSRKRPNILAAARAGKLRSNKKGSVTSGSLARAAKRGRVFWIAA